MSSRGTKYFLLFFFAILVIGWFVSPFLVTSAKRPKGEYRGQVEQIHSRTDMDQDGIDDQTDVLESALAYVAKKPSYKSNYYSGGYPDDGKGVCTDVVAFALLNAGYNLRDLVDRDIQEHPERYNIEVPDRNIDFRRVCNLKVYFYFHAVSLTTDLTQIDQWQGGDIVIFEDHIGIISDKRNKKGIPYVIHHNAPFQTSYEQDILGSRNDLEAHYRISR